MSEQFELHFRRRMHKVEADSPIDACKMVIGEPEGRHWELTDFESASVVVISNRRTPEGELLGYGYYLARDRS